MFPADLHYNPLIDLFQGGAWPMLARAKVALSRWMFTAPASNQNYHAGCILVYILYQNAEPTMICDGHVFDLHSMCRRCAGDY